MILAIDPGASGGFAWTDADGIAHCAPMPDGMTVIVDALRELYFMGIRRAVMEKVGGYVSGNSGPAAVKFGRHCGNIEAALYALGYSTEQVAPTVWQRSLGALPKDKALRKKAIKETMARRYPHLTVTLKTADALGILTWRLQ